MNLNTVQLSAVIRHVLNTVLIVFQLAFFFVLVSWRMELSFSFWNS